MARVRDRAGDRAGGRTGGRAGDRAGPPGHGDRRGQAPGGPRRNDAEASTSAPAADQWRRAPYFMRVDDPFWSAVDQYNEVGEGPQNPLLIVPEVDVQDASLVRPGSIARLCIEQGEYPYSPIVPQFHTTAPRGWSDWVDDVTHSAHYREILERTGLREAVLLSREFNLARRCGVLRYTELARIDWPMIE